jgi:hypothetical protein
MLEDECIKENKHSCEAIVKWAPVFGNALICGRWIPS